MIRKIPFKALEKRIEFTRIGNMGKTALFYRKSFACRYRTFVLTQTYPGKGISFPEPTGTIALNFERFSDSYSKPLKGGRPPMKYIIDTSSLLHHLEYVDFSEVIITILTLRELENHKSKFGAPELAQRAREALRAISEHEDVLTYDFRQVSTFKHLEGDFDPSYTDNRFLELLHIYREELGQEVGLITHDRALGKLAKAFKFEIKDYDNVSMESFEGTIDIVLTPKRFSNLKENMSKVEGFKNSLKLKLGQYAVIKVGDVEEMAVRYEHDKFGEARYREIKTARIIDSKFLGKNGDVLAKNLRQAIAIDTLHENKLSILTGKAGCGKSYLAIGYLLQEIHDTNKDTKVYIITNNVPMRGTSTFGLKKGDILSKILQSNLGSILKTKLGLEYTQMLIQKGQLNIISLEDIRGASFDGPVYVTEAQNYTKDMMKTIIERIEEDGQLILDGDERQIDMHVSQGINNGISRALEVFEGSELLGHVKLEGNMRGKLSEFADKM